MTDTHLSMLIGAGIALTGTVVGFAITWVSRWTGYPRIWTYRAEPAARMRPITNPED